MTQTADVDFMIDRIRRQVAFRRRLRLAGKLLAWMVVAVATLAAVATLIVKLAVR
jgi:cytidylate kinase